MNDKGFDILIQKLDSFIRKYYINKIIQVILLAITVYLAWYIIIITAVYFGHFSSSLRTSLFFITIIFYLSIFVKMIIIPFLGLLKIGKTINHYQASQILGKHFPDVSDKLQNTLELKELSKSEHTSKDIILASINQKTQKLSPIPFLSAIDLKKNLKYFKILGPICILVVSLLIVWPA